MEQPLWQTTDPANPLRPVALDFQHPSGYDLLFEANPNPMWVLDETTLAFLAVNQATVLKYGYSREELLGMTIEDIRPPEDVPLLLKAIEAQRGLFLERCGVWRHRTKQGELIQAEITVSAVTFNGKPARLALAHDITGRTQAEKALVQAQERLQFLLSSTPVVLYSCSPTPPYRLSFIGESVRNVLGYEAQEFLRDPDFWVRGVHPQDLPELAAILQRLPTLGTAVLRYRFRHKNGAYRWMRDDVRIIYDRRGAPKELLGSWLDITDRREAEEALLQAHQQLEKRVFDRTAELQQANQALIESQERFQQVAENSPDVFWLTDLGLEHIIYVSPAYEQIWGRPAKDLYRNPFAWFAAVHPEDQSRTRQLFEKPLRRQKLEYEYRVLRPDGSVRWVSDHRFRVRDKDGRFYRLAGITRDVTRRKELETELLHISEREQRRLGQDLHDDLGQQLVGIEFLSNALQQQLKGRPEEARAAEIGRLIRAAAEHTRRLARGLAPVLEAGGLLEALRALATRTSELFNIRCKLNCPGPVLIEDVTVATHLYRIAQEAVTNSIRHGHARQIEISLNRSGSRATLRIADNGSGLPKGPLNGNSLEQSPNDENRKGMGLRIMQHRANAIGGEFMIDSDAQNGTTVTCRITLGHKKSRKCLKS